MARLFLLLLLALVACTPQSAEPLPTLAALPDDIRRLEAGAAQDAALGEAAPVQRWQFFGREGEAVRLRVESAGFAPQMSLSLRGEVLAVGATIDFTPPENAVYQVDVQAPNGGTGPYQIALVLLDEDSNPAVPAVDTASPQPSHLAAPDTHTPGPEPGSPTPRQAVVGVPTPTPPFAQYGSFIGTFTGSEETGGLLTAEFPQHVYTFEGKVGQVVTLELLRVGGTLDPLLRLYDPQGRLIAMDDNSLGESNARLLNVRLPAEGTYSVQVDGAGRFGDYTIRYTLGALPLTPLPPPTVAPTQVTALQLPTLGAADSEMRLVDHAPVLSALERPGDFQRFSFFAEAGEVVSLRVQPWQNTSLLPEVEIFDPDGELIASADALRPEALGAAIVAGLSIDLTGAHILLVTGTDNSTGEFTVAYGRGYSVEDVSQGTVGAGEGVSATITEFAQRHVWRVPLHPGDSASIAVSQTGGSLDPVVELVTGDGTLLYRDDDSGANNAALIQEALIFEPASYYLRIYDATGENLGTYTLLWRYIEAAPSPTPIPATIPLLVVADSVPEGQYEFYVFQGRAGQPVEITVQADDTSRLDPVAALLDPAGNIIAEADDSGGSLNPTFRVTLPEDGSYSVRVNGYLSGGDFTLSVRLLTEGE